jgi:hypothetical protein
MGGAWLMEHARIHGGARGGLCRVVDTVKPAAWLCILGAWLLFESSFSFGC